MRTLVEIIASFAILANGVPSVALAAAGPPQRGRDSRRPKHLGHPG
jgi:hypothetical protein